MASDLAMLQHTGHVDSGQSPEGVTLLVAEYEALRAEIIHKQESTSKLVEITLIATGAFLAFGAESADFGMALMLFPILSALLGLAWSQQQAGMGEIGKYIRQELEGQSGGALHWEHYLSARRPAPLHSKFATGMPAFGVFIASQCLTLTLGCVQEYRNHWTEIDWWLAGVGALAIIVTVLGAARAVLRD